jgi:ABC-type thiamine transport system ATPase subunit
LFHANRHVAAVRHAFAEQIGAELGGAELGGVEMCSDSTGFSNPTASTVSVLKDETHRALGNRPASSPVSAVAQRHDLSAAED